MTAAVELNSVSVWHWRVPSTGGDLTFRYIQEVIPKSLAVLGTNRLTVHSDCDDYRYVAISDVVLWCRRTFDVPLTACAPQNSSVEFSRNFSLVSP